MPNEDHKHSIVAGISLVTIPLSDYADLLNCKRQLAERAISHDQVMSPARSVIERNPEVAVFLAQNFGLQPMKSILRLCRRRFGKERTPSRSAAYRYWNKLRALSKWSRESEQGPTFTDAKSLADYLEGLISDD